MTKQEIIDLCGKTAKEAQIRDDVCSRSLLIGLKYNPTLEDDLADPALFDAKVQPKFIGFRDKFLAEFGTTLCPEIQKQVFGRGYYYTNPEDAAAYFQITDHHIKCADVVEKAARMCAEFLLED